MTGIKVNLPPITCLWNEEGEDPANDAPDGREDEHGDPRGTHPDSKCQINKQMLKFGLYICQKLFFWLIQCDQMSNINFA